MTNPQGIDRYGVLMAVPPHVVAVVSLWVVIADGAFWGMAQHAARIEPWLCVLESLALSSALLAMSLSFALRVAASLLSAVIFGAMIFSFCQLVGFAALVAFQVGVMHYCALAVLSSRIKSIQH